MRLKARYRLARIRWAQFRCPHPRLISRTWYGRDERGAAYVTRRHFCPACGKGQVLEPHLMQADQSNAMHYLAIATTLAPNTKMEPPSHR